MRRADRLFRIVQLLRRRRFATAADIADELEVSRRTVYRDVRDLELSGVPIRGEAGVGYHLDRRFELPPLTFTTDEIEALVLGARVVQTWGDPQLAAAARSLQDKVHEVLPEPLRDVLESVPLFSLDLGRARERSKGMPELRRAIAERRAISFGYRKADGEPSERTVRPLGLYFWGTTWSLASWCELRRDFRNFRLDRISELRVGPAFPDDPAITLETFLEEMRRR